MQIVGSFTSSSEQLWALSIKGMQSRWNVYSPEPLDNSGLRRISAIDLNVKNIKAYNPYLIASCTCIGKGDIKACYGPAEVITRLMRALADFSVIDSLFSGEIETTTYTLANETLEIAIANPQFATITKLPGIEYEPYRQPGSINLSKWKYALGKSRVKSYEEVIKEYDTSWMYDAQGNLIKDYKLITTMSMWETAKETLLNLQPKVMSFDTETTGTKFYQYPGMAGQRSLITGCSISWAKDQGIYIPFLSTKLDVLPLKDIMDWLVPFLNGRKCVAHNGAFDFRVLYSYGHYLNLTDDTMLMEFNLNPHVARGSKGLKTLTRKYFKHETLELDDILGSNFNAELVPEIDGELIRIYACADTDYTLQLYYLLGAEIERLGRKSYSLDKKLIPLISTADFYGSHIDVDLLNQLSDVNKENLEVLEEVMFEYIEDIGSKTQAMKLLKLEYREAFEPTDAEVEEVLKDYKFQDLMGRILRKQTKKGGKLQISSDNDISHIMYVILDYPVTQVNPDTGDWKCNADAIADLLAIKADTPINFLKSDINSAVARLGLHILNSESILIDKKKFEGYQYPFAYLLSVWRSLNKFRTSFFDKLLNENDSGSYYTDNSMTSAETARVINPIQTMEGSLKQLIIPYSEDYYQIVFDMAQIEFRVMIGLANQYWTSLGKAAEGSRQEMIFAKTLDYLVDKLNHPETCF